MGTANSKHECPLCKNDRHTTTYLMPNSPYLCKRCHTEWNTKTGCIEILGKILREEDFPKLHRVPNSLGYLGYKDK